MEIHPDAQARLAMLADQGKRMPPEGESPDSEAGDGSPHLPPTD